MIEKQDFSPEQQPPTPMQTLQSRLSKLDSGSDGDPNAMHSLTLYGMGDEKNVLTITSVPTDDPTKREYLLDYDVQNPPKGRLVVECDPQRFTDVVSADGKFSGIADETTAQDMAYNWNDRLDKAMPRPYGAFGRLLVRSGLIRSK